MMTPIAHIHGVHILHVNTMDSIVTAVIEKFKTRAAIGKAKYGTDLDRKDLSILEWIQHAQEEHMDAILYLEKLKKELSCCTPDRPCHS
jgi:hypothetical protein